MAVLDYEVQCSSEVFILAYVVVVAVAVVVVVVAAAAAAAAAAAVREYEIRCNIRASIVELVL
jgi:hypothetical protein